MTERELYLKIKPLIEGDTEGLYWDFKKTLDDKADIIRDIMAFANSDYNGDSYIIVGVSEPATKNAVNRIALTKEDRQRLNTDANYIYLPGAWDVHGLSADDIEKMKKFSEGLMDKLEAAMLLCHPQCEFIPLQINQKRWLFIIVIKRTPGVFISKHDIPSDYIKTKNGDKRIVVKQGVLYVRKADITIGADPKFALATDHIRVWKEYLDWLNSQDTVSEGGDGNDQP